MTSQAFPIAALVLGHDADPSRTGALAALVATARDLGASPVVAAVPPGIELPAPARVVRTRTTGSRIGAMRLGIAQLADTPAPYGLPLPPSNFAPSLVAL